MSSSRVIRNKVIKKITGALSDSPVSVPLSGYSPNIKNQEFMERNVQTHPVNILLVEDNPADIRLTKEVFKEGKIKNTLNVVMDGEEAISYLKKKGKYKAAQTPDLVLLDLNLPKKDGREVLAEIKNDATLKLLPVIILTTSAAEQDVLHTYSNHANCYIMKPVDLGQFINVIRSIEEFWLTIVKLPKNS